MVPRCFWMSPPPLFFFFIKLINVIKLIINLRIELMYFFGGEKCNTKVANTIPLHAILTVHKKYAVCQELCIDNSSPQSKSCSFDSKRHLGSSRNLNTLY